MVSAIKIEVQGLAELSDRINRAGSTEGRMILNEGFRAIGRLFVPATGSGPLAAATPKVTGKLRRSTVFQIIGGVMNQVLQIRQAARSALGVFYGHIVREGRGPVEAKSAKALHFFIGGEEFFRKRVGPAKPNPYHIGVVRRLMPEIQRIVTGMGERITAFIAGESIY